MLKTKRDVNCHGHAVTTGKDVNFLAAGVADVSASWIDFDLKIVLEIQATFAGAPGINPVGRLNKWIK